MPFRKPLRSVPVAGKKENSTASGLMTRSGGNTRQSAGGTSRKTVCARTQWDTADLAGSNFFTARRSNGRLAISEIRLVVSLWIVHLHHCLCTQTALRSPMDNGGLRTSCVLLRQSNIVSPPWAKTLEVGRDVHRQIACGESRHHDRVRGREEAEASQLTSPEARSR